MTHVGRRGEGDAAVQAPRAVPQGLELMHITSLRMSACAAVLALARAAECLAVAAGVTVGGLRCEYAVDPVGIDTVQPRLSWVLSSDERGQRQTAYAIRVAASAEELERSDAVPG